MPPEVHDAMVSARERTFGLVAHLEPAELEQVLTPILSPLAWDLGHIAGYEDLWLNHRLAGRELLRPGLAELYDAFETPRAVRGERKFLRGAELLAYLEDVRARALEAPVGDGSLHEMVLRHELQHTETMLQAMALAGRLPPRWRGPEPGPGREEDLELLSLPGGAPTVGAPAEGFAYDNERPRHRVELAPFAIARRPVTNATWRRFSEGGGYERREWWSDEGWAWKQEYDITEPGSASAGHPDAPVVHVSWFEAAAFARSQEARLPTEVEWETAAASNQIQGVGEVWEWTSSPFGGYAGFRAHPYPEYSEVFFGDDYRVLRGWSRATAERLRSVHFRNWDRPQRRQLFAGVRLARGVT